MTFLRVRRLPVLFVALGAALLGAASCGVSREVSQPVATITFTDGTTEEVGSEYADVVAAITANEAFLQLIYGEQFADQVAGGQLSASVLTQAVYLHLIEHVAESVGAVADADAVTDATAQSEIDLLSALSNGGLETDTDGLAPYFEMSGRIQATISAVQGALAADVPCVSHILVDTEGEADDLIDQLAGGADFAALATEHSTDPGSGAQGGDLGCASADNYVPEFRDAVNAATEGEVVGPVQSQFGYHIILVTGYEPGSGETEADTAIQTEAQAVSVDVDPGIGTWTGGRVVAAAAE